MRPKQRVVELESLARIELSCRQRIERDPTDMEARISLAWCLFIGALHQAGRESIVSSLLETSNPDQQQLAGSLCSVMDRDVEEMLRDSLQQAVAVRQLSLDPHHQAEVNRLYELMMLSRDSETLNEADAASAAVLARVTRELFPDLSQGSRRLRRLPSRRRRE